MLIIKILNIIFFLKVIKRKLLYFRILVFWEISKIYLEIIFLFKLNRKLKVKYNYVEIVICVS